MKIKTAEELLKEKFWNGEYMEIHSGDWSDIIDIMQDYAEQFIDISAEEAALERLPKYDVREPNEYQVDKESILKIKELIK